ncbi:MAG TPA: Rid family detoxifying hydrolase [Flavitalea sp.]|nr:Rid family detoxifying hydrolase [Flavitalea sp.]
MDKKEIVHPEKADKNFSTGAYSAGVIAGDWLFVSGQGPVNFKTGKYELGEIEAETHLTMHNIMKICEQAGCTMENIVKCTVHLKDINDFDRYNAVYATYFKNIKPARTTVQSGLGEGIKIEIDAIALIK